MADPTDLRAATAPPNGLLERLAAELDAASRQLEALGAALCGDARLSRSFPVELQALDHAGQRCRSIATILRATDPAAALRDAPLESLAAPLPDGAGDGAPTGVELF